MNIESVDNKNVPMECIIRSQEVKFEGFKVSLGYAQDKDRTPTIHVISPSGLTLIITTESWEMLKDDKNLDKED